MQEEFGPIGEELRDTRERLGLTLEEAERATRIRAHHLEHIEAGDLEALPSPVQARGFLRNYADFLGLDADAVLLQYAEVIRARRPGRISPQALLGRVERPSVRIRSRFPRWLSADLFVAAGVVLAIAIVVVWGIGRLMSTSRSQTEDVGGGIVIGTVETPLPTMATLEPLVGAGAGANPPSPTPGGEEILLPESTIVPGLPINLRVQAVGRAWLQVIADGEVRFIGRVQPGQVLDFQGESLIEMRTGNAGALQVTYNGRELGVLGERDEVLVRLWDPEGEITPTPTVSPTPTATPPASPTGAPSATPQLTGTETPTPEG